MDYYRSSVAQTLTSVQSQRKGLSTAEARERTVKYGKNEILIQKQSSFLKLLLMQFSSYIIWLLIIIALFALVTGIVFKMHDQIVDFVIISFIVAFNALIGAYQDYKSERSAQLLQSMLKTKAKILRSGEEVIVDAVELTIGDIVLLAEGDKVPADCRIIECNELHVDESLLTGESAEVHKKTDAIANEVSLAERINMLFMDTFVTRGTAVAVIVSIGAKTEVGHIAESLNHEKPSLFIKEVDEAARTITYVALVLVGLASFFLWLRGYHWIDIMMIASALIIGSIPEGLPAIVTFSLAHYTSKLAERKVLVKRKSLLETLGSIDVVCTDKTGTLTKNRMTLSKLYLSGSLVKIESLSHSAALDRFIEVVLLANEAKDAGHGYVGPAEDIAFIDYCNSLGVDIIELQKKRPQVKNEPFSSETRLAASYNKSGKQLIRYHKGAPETILAVCDRALIGRRVVKLTAAKRKQILRIVSNFSTEALRTIACSYAPAKQRKDIFIGLAGLRDPPHDDIKEVVESVYTANIDLKMITGDSAETAVAVANECGFRNVKAINWNELKDLSAQQLREIVVDYNVFARMTPDLKLRIVSALQANGKRVAITGDGVNDVPALKQADVSIAMGARGADIAKEAADIILLDDHLSAIAYAIQSGRTVFSNIRKVLNYLLTTNIAEVLVVFFAALMNVLPFTAIQLLWVNFVTDVAPAMAFGIDPSHEGVMHKKPTGAGEHLINKHLVWLTVLISLAKVGLLLGLFFFVLHYSGSVILAQTATFTWLVLSHFTRVAAIRFDERVNPFLNTFLNWSIFIPLALQILILYTPLAMFFAVVPLGNKEILVLFISIAVSILVAQIVAKFTNMIAPIQVDDY